MCLLAECSSDSNCSIDKSGLSEYSSEDGIHEYPTFLIDDSSADERAGSSTCIDDQTTTAPHSEATTALTKSWYKCMACKHEVIELSSSNSSVNTTISWQILGNLIAECKDYWETLLYLATEDSTANRDYSIEIRKVITQTSISIQQVSHEIAEMAEKIPACNLSQP